MSTPIDVVTFGEAMVVLIADDERPLLTADRYRRTVAGAESNVAIGLSRLGHRARWVGRIGDDTFGAVVRRVLRGEGVDVEHVVVDPDAPTGLLLRDRHPRRPTEVVYHRAGSAGSRLCPGDLLGGALVGAEAVHLTGITPVLSNSAHEATMAAAKYARSTGVQVSFDPNLRTRLMRPGAAIERLRPIAALADVVLASQDEAEALSGHKGDRAADWFFDRGAAVVVLKRGAAGAWASDGESTYLQPAIPAVALDAVGAGDAFNAGFLSASLDGSPVEQALRTAAAVAAACVEAAGDIEGLPTRGDVDRLLAGTVEARR